MKMNKSIFNGLLAWYQSDFKGAIPFSASFWKMNKMNRFQWNQLISRNNWNEQILTNFQKIAFYRSVHLCGKLHIFIKWTDFKQFLWHNALTRTLQIDRFSRDFLLDIKRDTFGGKYQFFQPNAVPFSVKWTDFQWFLATDFKREPSTVWCTSIIKSPDFNEIKEND